jgi:ligand-binding sensor domain-containing protein
MATAQQNQMEVISELQGLSDNRIHSFYKDRQGFVWIGTANGLNRYDGQSFRIFSPAATHDVLSNEFINSITEDASGNLWIGTRGGLNMLNAQRDSLVVHRPGAIASGQNEKVIPSAWIWDAAIAADGKIWLASDGRDLTCFDPATSSFSYYPWLAFAKASMPERTNPYFSIRRIVAKSVNEWWLGTNAGLYSFNMATGAFSFYGGENGGDVGVLEYDSAAAMVYFAQESGSLYRFDLQANRLMRWTPGQLEVLAENQFTDASLLHGMYIPMKKYLVRFQRNGEMPEVILMKNLMESGDKYASARKVFTDDQHIKWIATDNGVLKFDPAVNLIHFVKVLEENSGGRVNAVFYDHASEKYFAASPFTNSLMLINARTQEREEIRQIDGVRLTDCAAVNEEDDTWLWILTRGNLFRYNRKTGQFSRFPAPADVKDFLFVEMVKDAEGDLWFATTNGGLFVYLTAEKRWWHPAEDENFYDRYVTSLCHDQKHGAVWVGTYDFGLFRNETHLPISIHSHQTHTSFTRV